MKKAITGGVLSLVGSIWALAVVFVAGNNLGSSWDSELGRFWSAVVEMRLMFLFVLAAVVTLLGIILMAAGLFSKEK